VILQRKGSETWFGAACRVGALEGVSKHYIHALFGTELERGFTEKKAAYLVLAQLGLVDGAEGAE